MVQRFLHIKASPRGTDSKSGTLAARLIARVRKNNPQAIVDEIDLFSEKLPHLVAETVAGKYLLMGGREIPQELRGTWGNIESHINRFLAADTILISTPMWNFGIPYTLKHYIDVIVQPRYMFRYGPSGPEGLAGGRRVIVISARGGDYGPESPARHMDNLEPYLRSVLSFIGIAEPVFINVQPMDMGGGEAIRVRLEEAEKQIDALEI